MRDPVRDLENFHPEGVPVDAMPASEVRRRGDRMRRRNNALATVGGVAAALAAVAVPLSLVNGDEPGRDIQPAPATEWRQEVPEGFPLDAGLTGEVRASSGARPLEQCARDTWSLRTAVDRADVSLGDGVEGFAGRTLAVYADPGAASAALARVEQTVSACADDPEGRLRYTVTAEDPGGPEAGTLVVVEQAELEEGSFSDLTFTRLTRDGNAVLVDQAYTAAGGASVVDQVSRNALERSALTRAALCVFDADPCDLETVLAEDESTGAIGASVPDDFPLADGLPAGSSQDGAFGPTGPGRDLEPIEPTVCSETVEDAPEPTDSLRAGWTSITETRQRQLMSFASSDDAERWVAAVRDLVEGCPEDDLGGGATRATALVPQDLGDESFTAISRNEQDGEPAPGLTVQQVVRVGQAVLLVQRIDESAAGGQVPEEVAASTAEESAGVVAAMQ